MKPEPSKESFAKFSKNPSVQRAVRFYALGNHYSGKVEHFGVTMGPDLDAPLVL